jgi:YesN/AraC family two-component response regulator
MARILIVDDDDQVRAFLKALLERSGHEVIEAGDGVEAISRYRADPSDIIITDIVMPEKEGIETIVELRGEFPDVKIIAISGGGRIAAHDYLNWARKFGVRHTFVKPVDHRELLAAVDELLGSASPG